MDRSPGPGAPGVTTPGIPYGSYVCTNTSYPPLPGLPGGNVWLSPEDLTNEGEHIKCSPITVLGELKAAWRALKFLESLPIPE